MFRVEGGDLYHSDSADARRLDIFDNAYQMLDAVPRGRDEDGLPWVMARLRRHDRFDT